MEETRELTETEFVEEFLKHSEKTAEDEEKQARDLLRKIEQEKMQQCAKEIDSLLQKHGFGMDIQFSYDPVNGINKMVILTPIRKD